MLLSSGERAQIFVKCETKFLSNASCVQAFGSTSIGSKFAFRDITSSVWEALRGTPKFKEWPVIVARRPFLPPQSVRLAPFRIVLVAVDPVIVLLLPSPPNDSATAGLEQGTLLGCKSISSACTLLSLELANQLVYYGQLLYAEGMYWLSPGSASPKLVPIPNDFNTYSLAGTNATLRRSGKFLLFSRSTRPARSL